MCASVRKTNAFVTSTDFRRCSGDVKKSAGARPKCVRWPANHCPSHFSRKNRGRGTHNALSWGASTRCPRHRTLLLSHNPTQMSQSCYATKTITCRSPLRRKNRLPHVIVLPTKRNRDRPSSVESVVIIALETTREPFELPSFRGRTNCDDETCLFETVTMLLTYDQRRPLFESRTYRFRRSSTRQLRVSPCGATDFRINCCLLRPSFSMADKNTLRNTIDVV